MFLKPKEESNIQKVIYFTMHVWQTEFYVSEPRLLLLMFSMLDDSLCRVFFSWLLMKCQPVVHFSCFAFSVFYFLCPSHVELSK